MARKKPNKEMRGSLTTADFLFEIGMLKNLPRSGWLTIGIKDCESVADHSLRTAAIAYILAKSEKLSSEMTEKVLVASIFHDLAETRTGDFNLLNKKYCSSDNARALSDALAPAGPFISRAIKAASANPKVAGIVHDADKLELVLQALEYVQQGNPMAKSWAENAKKRIKTRSGKNLLAQMLKAPAYRWLLALRKEKI